MDSPRAPSPPLHLPLLSRPPPPLPLSLRRQPNKPLPLRERGRAREVPLQADSVTLRRVPVCPPVCLLGIDLSVCLYLSVGPPVCCSAGPVIEGEADSGMLLLLGDWKDGERTALQVETLTVLQTSNMLPVS